MAVCRRILLSANKTLIQSFVSPGRLNGMPGVVVAWCSSEAGTTHTRPSHSLETSPPLATDTTLTDSPTPATDTTSAGWDVSKVERMLQETSQQDMPVEMHNPYEKERVLCLLCQYNVQLDYKNPRLLSQFVSPFTGRLYGRNVTRLCKKQQEELERTINKSRTAGYMPVMLKDVKYLKDPKLFDPNNPIRPHNF